MLEAQLNIFDVIVIFVLGFSALISFFRGFLREVFSLGAWLGAGIITLYAYPSVAALLSKQINSPLVANGFASMGTFIGSLIIISIFASLMLKYLKPGNEVGWVDNSLGLAFGVLRGMLLVAIGFYMMSLFIKPSDYPDWIANAFTRPHVEKMAGWVAQIAPNYLSEISPDPDDAPLADVIKSEDLEMETPNSPPVKLPEEPAPTLEPQSGSTPVEDIENAPFWPTMDELQNTLESEGSNAQ